MQQINIKQTTNAIQHQQHFGSDAVARSSNQKRHASSKMMYSFFDRKKKNVNKKWSKFF